MENIIPHSPAPKKSINITCKKSRTLQEYQELVYLTRDYYDAMSTNRPNPRRPLPDLSTLIDAHTIVNAYMEHKNSGVPLKLFNACLPTEQVVAVWIFANKKELDIQIGLHQLYAIKLH